jgi:hypothetical protein
MYENPVQRSGATMVVSRDGEVDAAVG